MHEQQATLGDFDGEFGLVIDLDDQGRARWLMDPVTGIAARSEVAMRVPRQPESCGRCHARRGVLTPGYEYGQALLQSHLPALLDDPLYFDDGQIRGEVYVYGSFLQSRMYRAGVTCSDCHDPHSLELVSADESGGEPSAVCSGCHLPQRFATVRHSRHEADEAACVDCHMPARTYMQVDARRDHGFRVPRPDIGVATGAPNACNNCHADRDAEWAAAIARDWWGKARQETPHFAMALHAARSRHANADLRAAIGRLETPGIARATALTLLGSPLARDDVTIVERSAHDADPLVRLGALRATRRWPLEDRARLAIPALTDPVRAIRVEAASLLADARDRLPSAHIGAFDTAAREYVAAQLAAASRPESHANLGNFAAASGDVEAALQHYGRALAFEPGFTAARVNLADLLRQNGDEGQAESVIRDGLVRDPGDAALQHSLGLLLVRTGRAEAGLAAIERAAEIDAGNARYVYVYAVALNSLGQADEALAALRLARERFATDFDIGWALATMLRDGDDRAAAAGVARELAAQYPEDRDVAALVRELDGD